LNHQLEARTLANPSHAAMIDLLSRKLPFICTNIFEFPGGVKGYHVTTVVGYFYSAPNIQFNIRDSNTNLPMVTKNLHCETLTYLQ
jgi:hypothetical protein